MSTDIYLIQQIPGPPGPSGPAGIITIVTVNAGNTPVNLPNSTCVGLCDVSSIPVTCNMPVSSLTSGLEITVTNDAGNAAANNITVNGGGIPIEDPNSSGTFSSTSVLLKVQSASVQWSYTGVHWKIV